LLSTGATNTIGQVSTGQFGFHHSRQYRGGSPTSFSISNALNIFAFRPDLNLGAFIQALEQRNLLQTLDEPTLITSDGKEASFLVGGEFPIPVLQGGANSGAVTIQFREFGVRLSFTPNITGTQQHSLARQAGSFLARLHQRAVVQRVHYPGAVHAQDGNQRRAGRRAELRDRRSHRQTGNRDARSKIPVCRACRS
jgi:hypothetical protein